MTWLAEASTCKNLHDTVTRLTPLACMTYGNLISKAVLTKEDDFKSFVNKDSVVSKAVCAYLFNGEWLNACFKCLTIIDPWQAISRSPRCYFLGSIRTCDPAISNQRCLPLGYHYVRPSTSCSFALIWLIFLLNPKSGCRHDCSQHKDSNCSHDNQ